MATKAKNIGIVVYDLDGTLVDSRADLTAALNRVRRRAGLPPLSIERVVGFIGDGQRNLVQRGLAGSDMDIDTGLDLMKRAYAEGLLNATTLYPGMRETLEILKAAGWRQAVATNKAHDQALAILEGLRLMDLLDAVVGADGELPLKPDPAPLFLARHRAGWDGTGPSWMVGDHHTDLESGRRAEFKCCLCRYGFGRPGEHPRDLEIDDPRELARHLRR